MEWNETERPVEFLTWCAARLTNRAELYALAPPVPAGASAERVPAWVAQNESDSYRKMFLRVEDVQGRNCLTNFWVRLAALRPTHSFWRT